MVLAKTGAMFITILALFLLGCTFERIPGAEYRTISTIPYDKKMCGGISSGPPYGSSNAGIRLMLKDKDTGEPIEGWGEYSRERSGGSVDVSPNGSSKFTCEEKTFPTPWLVSAYSKGHSPAVFVYTVLPNRLSTIEVFMQKSCKGGPSCLGNAKISEPYYPASANGTRDFEKLYEDAFLGMIERDFGLNRSDFTLSCNECAMTRGGFIKAAGTYKDGSDFELYYHSGWCSSGGADCGFSACFSSSSPEAFSLAKSTLCKGNVNCSDGRFEKSEGDKSTISISNGILGEFDCLAN